MRSVAFALRSILLIAGAGCSKSGAEKPSLTHVAFAPELSLQWPGAVPEGQVYDLVGGLRPLNG